MMVWNILRRCIEHGDNVWNCGVPGHILSYDRSFTAPDAGSANCVLLYCF
jgi:hypothetical protein